ncbi:hypothetical protein CHI09_14335 [Shouchella clausii]|uniref:Uncharacterized protein n=1 Tax=Shouchella clausii TaxID=79880 RepID=A0A268P180_SHOCL|nr:hypothetical protein CHI09_14335 [Shouchella clausii]PAE89259.1 hypothetical protein CHH72_08185 [Shouchella clausii]
MDITVSIMKKCLLPQGMIVQSSHAFKFMSAIQHTGTKLALFDFVYWFNHLLIYWSLNYLTPGVGIL